MIALAANDTLGLPCPGRLDCPLSFTYPTQVFGNFYMPVTDQILNYTSYDAIGALQLMNDRNNPFRLLETVPMGSSQLSQLPNPEEYHDDGDDWLHPMEELSDIDNYRDSRKVLSQHYNELSEAFNNSKQKECLEEEFKTLMNKSTIRARGFCCVVFISCWAHNFDAPPKQQEAQTSRRELLTFTQGPQLCLSTQSVLST
jgi:hypothetical protein